ncbi:transglycosylase domain-containing protein [Streptosporangium sandarakinum]|uniref:transglycosylase domain-containing protein n=1 Tax=Streptosporangium sandarakinum TaxID=1260955 RepID=UPI00341BEE56
MTAGRGPYQTQPGHAPYGAGHNDTVRLPQGAGPDPRAPYGSAAGRRPEAAFEDTQAMLAAARGAAPAGGPGDGGHAAAQETRVRGAGPGDRSLDDNETQVAGRFAAEGAAGVRARRRARGRGASGPGGPEGPGDDGRGGDGSGDEGSGGGRRRGWKRFLPSWKILVAGFVVVVAGVFGMIAVGYANTPVPQSTQDSVDDRGSVFYYADGKTAIARMGIKRTPVTIKQIPLHVQDAVIALENKTFRTDSGIDIMGMARSLVSTASGTQLQGASTITQQMARNYYGGLSQEVSIKRKVKEIFVAVKISKELPKDEILTRYLNAIYFGRGAYGIEAAAKAFFGKHVWQLTPPQGAYLAGRIQNPSRFDELEQAGNYAATKERYGIALRNMAEMDPANYGKYAGIPFEKLKFAKIKTPDIYKGVRGFMLDIVRKELAQRGITKEMLETRGLKVYTTFDKQKMEDAQKVVKARTAGLDPTIHASIASVDPRNGRVVAFYSGDDYLRVYGNRAFSAPKQAASAFKPYVLAAWLEKGYSLDSYIDGVSKIKMPGTTEIGNSHAAPYGPINMIKAMADSVNTVFAQMGEKVGLDSVAQIAKDAGVGEEAKKIPAYRGLNAVDYAVQEQKYQTTIGVASVTPVEQAAGYSIFANAGKHADWHTVIKVTDATGVVLPELATTREVITPETAADVTVALQAVVKSGTGTAANLGTRPVAGKTGTNNAYKDAWFVGFTPRLVTAVGMSKDVPYNKPVGAPGRRQLKVDKYGQPSKKVKTVFWAEEPMPSFIGGGGTPTQIWHDYMALATAKDPIEQFPPKAGVGQPNNLVEPKPTPSATEESEQPEDPFDQSWPDDGGTDDPSVDDGSCQPGDLSCDTPEDTTDDAPFPDDGGGGDIGNGNGNGNGNGGGNGNGNGNGGGDVGTTSPGAAIMSSPEPSHRRP